MRTLRIALVAATLVSTGTNALSAEAKVRDTQRYCRTSDGNGWSHKDVRQSIRCAATKWHVPGGPSKAVRIARCESGLNPRARLGQFSGVFQQGSSWWRGRFRQYNPNHGYKLSRSIWNARSNIVVSVRMMHAVGLGPWSCA
jgi:hypothetical protein